MTLIQSPRSVRCPVHIDAREGKQVASMQVCSGLREKAIGHSCAFLESRAHEKKRTSVHESTVVLESRAHEKKRTSVHESTVVLESRAHLCTKAQYFHGRHSLVSTDAKQIRFGLHRLICTAWSAHTHTHTHKSAPPGLRSKSQRSSAPPGSGSSVSDPSPSPRLL